MGIIGIGQKVETVNIPGVNYTGMFAGFATSDEINGIIILDKPAVDGCLAITCPIVCMKHKTKM